MNMNTRDKARYYYLAACEAIEDIKNQRRAKAMAYLVAEAYAHYLRTGSDEWIEELRTLQKEAEEEATAE